MKFAAARAQAVAVSAREIDRVREHVLVETAALADDNRNAERHEKMAADSRESARARRIRIGQQLAKIRPTWPAHGPVPEGSLPPGAPATWAEFLTSCKLDDATARRYMAEARDPDGYRSVSDTPKAKALALIEKLSPEDRAEIVKACRVNVSGGSGETDRGAWITAKLWADAVGPFDLDPFSNPRSHIEATIRCMLEDGGDGLGADEEPGSWIAGPEPLRSGVATADTRVWIQPPYDIVERVIAHYGHTRFCALLRLDSSTAWFAALWERTQVLALPKGTREFFDPPPGVPSSSNPQPHAFFYADPRDITDAIRETCILLMRYEAAPLLRVVR